MPETSKLKIAIIDYEAGNLFSVQHACSFVGLEAEITSDKTKILEADGVILPGVGAFGPAMANLNRLGLVKVIKDYVETGKPFMGICLGLQLLFSESEEFGLHQGLDLIKGRVVKFPSKNSQGATIKVPQIGWNQIFSPVQENNTWANSTLKGIAQGEFMYFVHSYYVTPSNPGDILAITNYDGVEYCSSVQRNNIFATQFHPEKSAQEGIKIYRNWALEVAERKKTLP